MSRSLSARSHGGNSRFPPWAPLPKTARTSAAVVGRARHVGRGDGAVEVDDARAEHERLGTLGVEFLAEPYEPPPSCRPGVGGFAGDASSHGGCRFFCVDPDGYLVEIEQNA